MEKAIYPNKVVVSKTKSADGSSRMLSLAELAKDNLMGDPVKPVVKEVKQEKILDTKLKIVLVGTITTTDGGKASALIQGSSRETKRYFTGEMIEAGVFLDSVAVDSVMLKRNGQLETLRYPASSPTTAATSPTFVSGNQTSPTSIIPNNPSGSLNQPATDTSKKIMSLRERLKQNRNPHPGAGDSQGKN